MSNIDDLYHSDTGPFANVSEKQPYISQGSVATRLMCGGIHE